jgi:hypothetical protein
VRVGRIDVHKARAFGGENYLVKRVPIAIGVFLLGAFLIVLSRIGDGFGAAEGLFFGSVLIAGSLAFVGYAFYRRSNPKPVLELFPEGILYPVSRDRELRIPWSEVQGLGLVELKLRRAKFPNVIAVSVSQDFFDAHLPVNWRRGLGRRFNFIPSGDMVQIALDHVLMSVSAEELWNEIETRWRVLGDRPNAQIMPVPKELKTRKWFGG